MASKKVACVVCDHFEPQNWRKTMCKNCFHTLPEHATHVAGRAAAWTKDNVTTFDVSISYESNVTQNEDPECDDGQDNVVNINLEADDSVDGSVGISGNNNDVNDTTGGDVANPRCEVSETISISLPKEKTHVDSLKKPGVVSSAVKSRQTALFGAKTRGVNKFGSDKRHVIAAPAKGTWTKPIDAHAQVVSEKPVSDGEMLKVARFGKSRMGADSKDTDISDKVKSGVDREDGSNKSDTTQARTQGRCASVSGEEDDSNSKVASKTLAKDLPLKTVVKSDNARKDVTIKIRRNSNSSNGANSEATPERKASLTKQRSSPLIGGSKGKPSTPPLLRALSRDGKPGQGKVHTSPKSSPKLSLRRDVDSAEIAELKVKIGEMERRCKSLEKENTEMAEVMNGKSERETHDKALIESLTKRMEMFDRKSAELERVKGQLVKAGELEREFKQAIVSKEGDIQKLQRLIEEKNLETDNARDDNADLQLEIREMRQEMEEMYDQFRETEIDEFRDLQKELEITAKNCRLLQFKLRKCERKSNKAESDRQHYEFKIKELQNLFEDQDAKAYIRTLEGDMGRAKSENVHLQDELDMAEEKRHRTEDENRKLQEILEKTDKKQFRMEMEIDKLHDQIEDLKKQLRDGTENSDDESSQRKILDANQIWRL